MKAQELYSEFSAGVLIAKIPKYRGIQFLESHQGKEIGCKTQKVLRIEGKALVAFLASGVLQIRETSKNQNAGLTLCITTTNMFSLLFRHRESWQ